MTFTLRAQCLGRAAAFGNGGPDADHGWQRRRDGGRQVGAAAGVRATTPSSPGGGQWPTRLRNRSTLGHPLTSAAHHARPQSQDRRLPSRLLYDGSWRPPPIRSKSPTNPPGQAAPARRAVASTAHLDGLNEEQRQAVTHAGGPLLVLAGAGTGKTRVLTTRIAHLLLTGQTRPSQVLAVTFTNKAAREMLDRVASLIGGAADGMWLGTFHSIGVRVLRRHAELIGLKSNFTILDTDDQTRLIKQLLQAEGIDDKKWPARILSEHHPALEGPRADA